MIEVAIARRHPTKASSFLNQTQALAAVAADDPAVLGKDALLADRFGRSIDQLDQHHSSGLNRRGSHHRFRQDVLHEASVLDPIHDWFAPESCHLSVGSPTPISCGVIKKLRGFA